MKPLIIFAFTAAIALAADKSGTFTGVITDTMCKKDHSMMKIAPDAKCAAECVENARREICPS